MKGEFIGMKKKKLLIGTILASAVLGLSACGGDQTPPDVPPIVEAEECSVTFETSGGSKVDGTKVKNGEKVNQPTDPIREGYTFGGWYRKPSCLEVDKWDFTKNNVTADITLYAKWTANKYTVTFKIDGEVYKTQSVEYDKAPKEEKPEREGHTFNGWYTDELCSADKKFDFKSGKVKGETTLYGKWEASGPVVGDKYTVTYVINGHGTQPEGLTDVTTLPASLPVLSEEGWSFGGWYTDNNTFQHQVEGGQAITENTTLYAKWIENEQPVLTYTITYVINGHGTQPEGLTDVTTLPASLPVLSEEGWSFGGWYTDNNTFQHQVEGGQAITENTTLYAKWTKNIEYEEVDYILKDTDFVVGTSTEDLIVNSYTIKSGTEMRVREKTWTNPDDATDTKAFKWSMKLAATPNLVIQAPGNGKLAVWVQNGSGGAQTQKITFGKQGETMQTIEFAGVSTGSPIVRLEFDVEEGCTYQIGRPSGTVDLYWAEMVCSVEKSEIVGFEIVSKGKTEYLPNDTYDSSKLVVQAVYGNGRKDVIPHEELIIDSSEFQSNEAGVYDISVKYKEYDAQIVPVAVYAISDLLLGFNKTIKGPNSQAGNGVYLNQTVKRIYKIGDTSLDISGMTVTVQATHPVDTTKTKEFIVPMDTNLITGFDTTASGEKTITITYALKEANYSIWVVDTAPSIVNEVVQVKVDQNYTGTIGAIEDGFTMFTSIQQALDFLNCQELAPTMKKLIYVEAGLYKEKLEINLPYLSFVGADKETTIIEWDSLYGLKDESGFEQVTDSTQTLAVRDSAVGCTIENITISNYWNSLDRFDAAFNPGYSEHRALAILIQADQFKMKNCKLLGYQDTIELFTGRQWIEDTYIAGTTDFIFGTNNTTYFKNCTIHSINSEANRGDKTDGGYITAFKGSNKGEGDTVEYGAIFDGCSFTADAKVLENSNTAIGRTWGAYAAVMVMNSTLGAHISKTENTTGTAVKNVRYASMNSINVSTTATLKFFEYNNTGEGAITESQVGVTVLTDLELASKYADYTVIFGTTNGKVTYTNAWNPSATEVEEDPNSYYFFNGGTNPTGTVYTYDLSLGATDTDEKTAVLGELTLDATNGKIVARAQGDTQINKGGKISFTAPANTIVVIATYPGYHNYSINGNLTNLDTYSVFFAEETAVEIVATDTMYLYSIIFKPNQEAPEVATLESLQVTGQQTEFAIGEAFSAELEVKATYSDGTIKILDSTEYTLNSDAVNVDVAGTYEVSVSFGGISFTYNVTYVAEVVNSINTTTTWSFKDDQANAGDVYFVYGNQAINPSLTFGKLTLTDNGQGVVADNGDWLKFNVGAKASFEAGRACTLSLVFYQNQNNVSVDLDGVEITPENNIYSIAGAGIVTITAVENGYLGKITATFTEEGSETSNVVSVNTTYSFNSGETAADNYYVLTSQSNVQGSSTTFDKLTLDATTGKISDNGGQWFQYNTGAKISFTVAAGATVTIVMYQDSLAYTVNDEAANEAHTYTFAEETLVTIASTGNGYIGKIIINFTA